MSVRAASTPTGMRLLKASAVPVSTTGDLNENTLATVTIPAGAMGLNGGLLIYSTWTTTNSANNKITRIRLGGIAGQLILSPTLTTIATFHDVRRVRNRNSASSQVVSTASATTSSTGTSAAAVTTFAVDMSTPQDVVFTGQLALSTETITLESYEVWLLP